MNMIKEHNCTIELYEYAPDPNAERRLEETFDKLGIEFEKADRYWIQEEQLYQIVYDFDHIEKIGGLICQIKKETPRSSLSDPVT